MKSGHKITMKPLIKKHITKQDVLDHKPQGLHFHKNHSSDLDTLKTFTPEKPEEPKTISKLADQYIESPNYSDREEADVVEYIILHYTATSLENTIHIFTHQDPEVSAHYVVDTDGKVVAMVPEEKIAYHAGLSSWKGQPSLNKRSIGIEIVNPGYKTDGKVKDDYFEFPEEQIEKVIALCTDIKERYNIPIQNVIGHADVAPDRKVDPGPKFPWKALADANVAIMPESIKDGSKHRTICRPGDTGDKVVKMQNDLQEYGYKLEASGVYDEQTEYAVKAFKAHFVSDNYDTPGWNDITDVSLEALLSSIKTMEA